jgi:MFS family permease
MSSIARIRISAFFGALALNLFSPFISMYALRLGATNFQIGLISSLTTLVSVIAQLLSLPFTLSLRKKLILYIVFDSIGAIFFIPIAFVENVSQLIFYLSLQAFFFSFPLQIWNEFQIKSFPKWNRGTEIGVLNKIAGIGAFIAYVVAGYVIRKYGFIPYLFFSAAFLDIISNLVLIGAREEIGFPKSFRSVIKEILRFEGLKNIEFRKLLLANFVFNFAVAVGAPMFSVHLIKNLGANSIQLSIVSIISLVVSIIFSEAWGRVADFVGRREVIIAGLPLIAMFPFLCVISTNMLDIYLFNFIGQIGWVAFNIAMFSYLADVSGKSTPIYFAIFNAFSSIATIVGSIVSGYMADIVGIKNVLMISFYLRAFSIFFFLSLGEKKGHIPRGTLPFLSPYSLFSSIESFISIYSLVFEETRKSIIERMLRSLRKLLRNQKK